MVLASLAWSSAVMLSPRMVTSSSYAASGIWVTSTVVRFMEMRPMMGALRPRMIAQPPGRMLVEESSRRRPSE